MDLTLFRPIAKASFVLNASATNTQSTTGQFSATQQAFRIYNAGPNPAYICYGEGTQTASATTDMIIAPGDIETFGKAGDDTIAAICASGQTATLYITPGEGA